MFLTQEGIKIGTISFDAVCKYDEDYLVPRTNLENKIEKNNCNFYYGEYSPNTVYNQSKYCKELRGYYNSFRNSW